MQEPKPDGRFFMPYDKFVVYFNQFSICMYEDNYVLSSFTEELESTFMSCYKFTICAKGDYFVSMSQPDERGFPQLEDGTGKNFMRTFYSFLDYSYSCNGLLLCCKDDQGNMKFIGGK